MKISQLGVNLKIPDKPEEMGNFLSKCVDFSIIINPWS